MYFNFEFETATSVNIYYYCHKIAPVHSAINTKVLQSFEIKRNYLNFSWQVVERWTYHIKFDRRCWTHQCTLYDKVLYVIFFKFQKYICMITSPVWHKFGELLTWQSANINDTVDVSCSRIFYEDWYTLCEVLCCNLHALYSIISMDLCLENNIQYSIATLKVFKTVNHVS